jgi:3-hydroxyisobutyrate dehydrogenase-like beta-hydroxyacid dehydrogenase
MAQNLLSAGHTVVVYSRTHDKVMPLVNQGAVYAATPRDAALQAEVVISMVTDDQASRTIWLTPETGAIAGLNETQIAIESSTLTVEWIKTLAVEIDRCGAAFLDAPVVGSRPQADAGKLIYLVGGRAETVTRVQAVLADAGGITVHHVGELGHGMAMKLAVNALFGIQVAALAEMIALLTKTGLSSATAMECLGELPVISPAAKNAGNLMLTHNHAPLFPISLVEKDFRNTLQTAQAADASIPVAAAAHNVYLDAIAKGYSSDNITGVIQLYEL